jgi:type IV secretion system protein VirD4
MRRASLRGASIFALCAAPVGLIATPVASMLLWATFFFTHLVNVRHIPPLKIFYCWWYYLFAYGDDPRFSTKLALTMGVPVVLMGLAVLSIFLRRGRRRIKPARPGQMISEPERAASKVHGNADWLTMQEAAEIFPGENPDWGGIPVAEAYRPDMDPTCRPFKEADPATWGQGGKAPLLLTPLNEGAISGIIIAGSGSYKTTGFTIPAMCTWQGSAVVLDPKREVGRMVGSLRRRMGQKVALVDPKKPAAGGFNVLSCIDLTDPLAIVHLTELVEWCLPPQESASKGSEKNEAFFVEAAKEMALALLVDMLHDPSLPASQRTIKEWRRRMVLPERELREKFASIYAKSAVLYSRQLAGTIMGADKETFSNIYKHLTSDTKWLSIPAYADLLSGDAWNPADLVRGNLTVIVQIPDEAMKATPAVARVIIGAVARIVMRAEGQVATPIPFILDEMDLLGNMPILSVLRDMGRGGGAALFPMWQSIGQIEKTWGQDGKKAWYASAAWRLYAMVNDEATADEVSKRCGTYTALARNEGTSVSTQNAMTKGTQTRGTSDSVSERPQPLLSPYEVQTALRPDEAIVIPKGKPAMRCGRPLFWRRPEMADEIDSNRLRREHQQETINA